MSYGAVCLTDGSQPLYVDFKKGSKQRCATRFVESFFTQHQTYCFVKKTKALLLLQIDETYIPAIAAMECVFLRYIDECKFRSRVYL